MSRLSLLLLPLAIFGQIHAECPAMDSVPTMYDDTTFTCARKWFGKGDDQPIQGCNDCPTMNPGSFTVRDGYESDPAEGKMLPVGSILVMPGKEFWN